MPYIAHPGDEITGVLRYYNLLTVPLIDATIAKERPYSVYFARRWSVLTPFGRLIVTMSLVLLLLSTILYFFVITRHGQNFLCQRGQICFVVNR